jgi:hypothetical protein
MDIKTGKSAALVKAKKNWEAWASARHVAKPAPIRVREHADAVARSAPQKSSDPMLEESADAVEHLAQSCLPMARAFLTSMSLPPGPAATKEQETAFASLFSLNVPAEAQKCGAASVSVAAWAIWQTAMDETEGFRDRLGEILAAAEAFSKVLPADRKDFLKLSVVDSIEFAIERVAAEAAARNRSRVIDAIAGSRHDGGAYSGAAELLAAAALKRGPHELRPIVALIDSMPAPPEAASALGFAPEDVSRLRIWKTDVFARAVSLITAPESNDGFTLDQVETAIQAIGEMIRPEIRIQLKPRLFQSEFDLLRLGFLVPLLAAKKTLAEAQKT